MPTALNLFDLSDVRLLDGPFGDNLKRGERYLLDLEADRLLHAFRLTAGQPSRAVPLGGWEAPDCELRGHTLGHALSGLALMYASTGNEVLKDRAAYLVAELAACQETMPLQGYNEGYLSAYPEDLFDRWQQHRDVWAPYYTLHKLMAGLLDVYLHCENDSALGVLLRLASWLQRRFEPLLPLLIQIALMNEPGGMSEVLANLYAVTGNGKHLALAQTFSHRILLESLAKGEDQLDNLHAHTQIPKLVGAARTYELTGEEGYRQAAVFFWQRVARHRSWVIGGNSENEFFFPPAESSEHLSAVTAETCNTYNMLKLTRHLFAWEPLAETLDFYERALYNHILASQDPDSAQTIYFASLRPGHFKLYSTPHDSFWCCTGTGMENHAKYGELIYAYRDEALLINLFIASELTWQEKGLTLRQTTRFPDEAKTRLSVTCAEPITLTLSVRRPSWSGAGFAVWLNGEAVDHDGEPGAYINLRRLWQTGDTVEVSLAMQLHLEALPDDPGWVSVLYGPVVLAAELGREHLPPNGEQALGADHHAYYRDPVPEVPKLTVHPGEQLLTSIERVDAPRLAFRTVGLGTPRDVSLIPFFRLHHQRYTVYLEVLEAGKLD